MAISDISAHCTIEGIAPYTQSRMYDEPKLEGETGGDYDRRNWQRHLHVQNGTVHIPARAIHMALVSMAKYSKRQIPGQGKATWTQKFASGIALFSDIDLGIKPEDVDYIDIPANANGQRGSGTRVIRRLPTMLKWKAEFTVTILDPIITHEIFSEMLGDAGMYIGIGQYRPENSGTNGRWNVVSIDWHEDRKAVRRPAA